MCLAQGHNAVRLEPVAPRSRVKTSGCGIHFNNTLQATGLIGAVFRFHVYYQTRRLLKEMSIALPQDKNWTAFDSNFDRDAYERLCREFNVDVHSHTGKSIR